VPRCLQVNAVTHLGQPALLYLCPLTLGSVALVAATRGDLGKIWAFTDTTLVTSPPGSSKEKKEQERHAAAAAEAAARTDVDAPAAAGPAAVGARLCSNVEAISFRLNTTMFLFF
jgi:hypothetical protein